MDWAKAKSILIIAFIITNLFLGYNIWKDSEAKDDTYIVSDERINDIKAILQEKNIIVKADVPKEIIQLPKLTVKYEIYDRDEIEEKFPGFVSIDEENIKYSRNNEIIKVPAHKKSITYTNSIESSSVVEFDENKAKETAYDFIKYHGFLNDDVELWNIKGKDGRYEIEYKQKYKDMTLNDGYMKLKVKAGVVTEFERRWLKTIDIKTFDKKIIPATKALLLALEDLNKEKEKTDNELVIADIDLVYSLHMFSDHESELPNMGWYEVEDNNGVGYLYWIIRLGNNNYIPIEAESYD